MKQKSRDVLLAAVLFAVAEEEGKNNERRV
jgi:hypothetical protein